MTLFIDLLKFIYNMKYIMCAIYGSTNRNLFDILHDATKDRGSFASSFVFLEHKKRSAFILRLKGHPNSMDKLDPEQRFSACKNKNITHYLGHSQAPTSSQREHDVATSHPFVAHNWVVAHNGVLTNYKEINKKYCAWNKNPVDSSNIPHLFHALETQTPDKTEVEIICESLSLLEGTFGLWIFNEKTGNIFLARQGSTLFANEKGDFCSIQSKNWFELEEGTLYKATNKLEIVGNFKNTSPFFTL
jgi:glucosamine 6-phosphate synthetase-like amidotransferase/phosphosugar isomerase protein